MANLVVYTAITAGKDKLHEPAHTIPGVEYVCFTDAAITSQVFTIRPLPFTEATPRLTARRLKLFAHTLFPNHEASLWLDGSKRIRRDLTPLLAEMARSPLTFMAHPERTSVYAEAEACMRLGRDNAEAIAAQAAHYRAQGLPENSGLYETSVFFRRHTTAIADIMENWWRELLARSPRDQLSLPFVLWQAGITPQSLPFRQWHDPYFLQYPHNWHENTDNRTRATARLHGAWWRALTRLGLHTQYEKAARCLRGKINA
ncbi:MAG: DUF616 domain-containing protein [Rickettsiales bacterium]|nr:DUF616 domain-containing protein [Rickettsiales bacterium]